ncbi:MAG: LytR/AlgR family response regulator transcription factor [Bacteroidia bacterium]
MKDSTLRCLIIDDEPLAQKVLEKYVSLTDALTLVQSCNSAFEAMNLLRKEAIDLIFLDIDMPEMTGLELLKTLKNPPKVILTTAYSEYALQSYEFGVIDYLLKPISYERFFQAIDKVLEKQQVEPKNEAKIEPNPPATFLFLKADKKLYKTDFQDIYYFEGCGNYIRVVLKNKMLTVLEKMGEVEAQLPPHLFVRIHKSYIISIEHIQIVEGNSVIINNQRLPIGESYKPQFEKVLENYEL